MLASKCFVQIYRAQYVAAMLVKLLATSFGQNKMKRLSPIPLLKSPPPPLQSNDEGAKEQKRAISASLKWGWGGVWFRFIIYFVAPPNLVPGPLPWRLITEKLY